MKEDPEYSNDNESDFDQDFSKVKKQKMDFEGEEDWMDLISKELDSNQTGKNSTEGLKKVRQPLDFDEDDSSEGNTKAKLEILEITADNWASYTEMQILVRYLEDDLHVERFGDQKTFIMKDFDSRKNKLDKDTMEDVTNIENYLKSQPADVQKKIHDDMVNNMAGISELSTSEDSDGASNQNNSMTSDDIVHTESEVSNPLKLQKEKQELADLQKIKTNPNGNSMEGSLNAKDLMEMLGGPTAGEEKGGPGLVDMMKMMGGGEKDSKLDFGKLANAFSEMMKNPEMAKMMNGNLNEKGSADGIFGGLPTGEGNSIMDKLKNEEMDDVPIFKPQKLSLKEKFDLMNKKEELQKKFKKRGMVLLNKPKYGGNYEAKAKIEKVEVNKDSGDKDVFIDFGEDFEKKFSDNKTKKKEKEEPNRKLNNDITEEKKDKNMIELKDFDTQLKIPLLGKVGKYVKKEEKKSAQLVI